VFFGALTPAEIWKSQGLIELATRRGHFWRYRDYLKGARLGREILANANAFMGRTAWDRAHLASVNPTAAYYHGDELLRPQFSDAPWQVGRCERHSVIFTNSGSYPRRGMEVLIHAMQIVRRDFPRAALRLAGALGHRGAYDRFVHRMIADAGLAGSVEHLGYLGAAEMAQQLRRSHVFAQPSFVENGSNSLSEAMQVGVPCIAAFTGGMTTTIVIERTGLMFPPGDAAMLAQAIARIFRDDHLATRLGQAARASASVRHDPARVVAQVMRAYRDLAGDAQSGEGVQHVTCSQSR
jgi:glycosyltransferase involved in cell wall biosynthesis